VKSESRRFDALAHLEMARPYTVFYPALSAVAGLELASAGQASLARAALTAVVTMLGWIAALYAGDYYDRHLDAKAKPGRPIPSGRVTPREAFSTMVGLIGLGYVGAWLISPFSLALAILATILAIAYSKTFKARGLLGNLDRGLLGGCAVLFGALAAGNLGVPAVWALAVLLFFHDSASNLVGTLRDVQGDRDAAYRTLPVVHGIAAGVRVASGLALAAALCTIALLTQVPLDWAALLLFALSGVLTLFVYGRLWRERRTLNRAQALTAHKHLVIERVLLMGAVIAVHVPKEAVILLLGSTLVLTAASQRAFRDRYELEVVPGS
jgi:4-hydroxybenzoate polyprenyltransferase/geranylgeranylglycerol-phosphate geranylgeranyltransferase